MFSGQYRHNIDEKGRLTVPARFREIVLAEGAYVLRGFDQNLMVLTSPTFNFMAEHIKRMNLTDPAVRLLRRMLYGSAYPVEMDKAGRILLPQLLRQFAGLGSDVVLVGMDDFFEIWSPANWEAQNVKLQDPGLINELFAPLQLSSG